MLSRPADDEFAPYYARYIALVPDGDVLATLERQGSELAALLASLADDAGDRRYAPGKWSVREMLGHMADTERVFAYRALRIARGDATPLAGFEQDDYVRDGGHGRLPLVALAGELAAVRQATLWLFRNMAPEAGARRGTASGAGVTVRALAWMIAGHERHHLALLVERYLA